MGQLHLHLDAPSFSFSLLLECCFAHSLFGAGTLHNKYPSARALCVLGRFLRTLFLPFSFPIPRPPKPPACANNCCCTPVCSVWPSCCWATQGLFLPSQFFPFPFLTSSAFVVPGTIALLLRHEGLASAMRSARFCSEIPSFVKILFPLSFRTPLAQPPPPSRVLSSRCSTKISTLTPSRPPFTHVRVLPFSP